MEAQYSNGAWYAATILEVDKELNWYTGAWEPAAYTVKWSDGDSRDTEKTRAQLRRKRPARVDRKDLEDLPRFASMAVAAARRGCFAVCAEVPTKREVWYEGEVPEAKDGGSSEAEGEDGSSELEAEGEGTSSSRELTVGDEIVAFGLDETCPFMPFYIKELTDSGPAQDEGVQVKWFLDLPASVHGPSRDKLAEALDGIAGFKLKGKSKKELEKLIDASYGDLPEVLRRLNGPMRRLTGIALVFTSSCSASQVQLLPEAVVTYTGGRRVGSEVRVFQKKGKRVHAESFLKMGPAQEAGVRPEWVLDIERTLECNPGKADGLLGPTAAENPNALLALTDVSLVFCLQNPDKTQKFQGSGPPGSKCWHGCELPGDSVDFEFSTDGDPSGDPAMRWGVFAIVVPKGSATIQQHKLDEAAATIAAATMMGAGPDLDPQVERDGWDESRLRALCAKHGWEFSWMSEDGERRRLAREGRGLLAGSPEDLAVISKKAQSRPLIAAAHHEEADAKPDGYAEH